MPGGFYNTEVLFFRPSMKSKPYYYLTKSSHAQMHSVITFRDTIPSSFGSMLFRKQRSWEKPSNALKIVQGLCNYSACHKLPLYNNQSRKYGRILLHFFLAITEKFLFEKRQIYFTTP